MWILASDLNDCQQYMTMLKQCRDQIQQQYGYQWEDVSYLELILELKLLFIVLIQHATENCLITLLRTHSRLIMVVGILIIILHALPISLIILDLFTVGILQTSRATGRKNVGQCVLSGHC